MELLGETSQLCSIEFIQYMYLVVKTPGIEQNKKSYSTTKGMEKEKTPNKATLSISVIPHPRSDAIHIELPVHPP